MKNRVFASSVLVFAWSAPVFGGYVYDYSQNPVVQDNTRWSSNGSPSYTSTGVSFSSPGSLISNQAISGVNPNDCEINTTLAIKAGGGTFIHFFRASSGTVAPGSGSYESVELTLPATLGSPGTLAINEYVNGTQTPLGSLSIPVSDGMNLRTVAFGSAIWVYVNNVQVWGLGNLALTAGNPGIGGSGMSAGTGFTSVQLGHHDVVAPSAVSTTTAVSSILPYSVALRWAGVLDDANGIGLAFYTVTRNGVTLTSSIIPPEAVDNTVVPSTNYVYQIEAWDYHGNVAYSANIAVSTPPAGAIDPRRVGVFTTGSYWGGGGEQIDTLSGNLNFTLPLLTAQGRTGWTVPVNLSYNSQNWRQDGTPGSPVNWQLGDDVGYGFGWKAQIGSITPYYVNWWGGADHYVFEDGSGAQYRLDQNNNGIWSSSQGIYVWFDANADVLHFRDGTFWKMGCTSGGTEADAGTMYPTIVEDVNGNQVLVTYLAGAGLAASNTNTSARFSTLEDVRGNGRSTYTFTWNADAPVPHLTQISNLIGTSESFTFGYAKNVTLEPPFGADPEWAGQSTTQLASLTPILLSPYAFTYDTAGAGELQQVTFPYGGHLRWTYGNDAYNGSRELRAVTGRYLAADSAGATEWSYGMSRDNASAQTIHGTMTLTDASGVGTKTWSFIQPGGSAPAWQAGLIASFVQAGGSVLQSDSYTWSQTPVSGNPYIGQKVSVKDPGSANPQSALTTQTLDQYGNATGAAVYPYNNTTAPLRSYASTYLNSATYTANYIFNRLLTTTLTTGGTTITLVSKDYTTYGPATGPTPTTEYDANPPIPFDKRALLAGTTTPAKTTRMGYYSYGGLCVQWASDGNTVSLSADAGTNYAAPQSISTQSYSETVGYNSWLGITQTTGANGEQLSMVYDTLGRPYTGTSAYGAVTRYTYSAPGVFPATQTQSGPTGTTTTTLDGVGRAIRVVTNGAETDTVYAPCACSPLGKVQKVSAPYPAGGSAAGWTVYTYDGIGRTLSVQQPDGASTTNTSYSGNQTTVTDPAGKWKTFTSDVEGNLTTVVEPDPANQPGGTLTTSYTYDWMGHLTGVSMPRGGTTQTRAFVYDTAGRLTSATNPENGTVLYYYNSDNTLSYKHDALGQETVYTYDSEKRVTEVQRYPNGRNGIEDLCQEVNYSYDANPYDATGTYQYTLGRLAAVVYPVCAANLADGQYQTNVTMTEMYSYTPAGGVAIKHVHPQLQWYNPHPWERPGAIDMEVDYGYTTWGAVASVTTATGWAGATTSSDFGFTTTPNNYDYSFDSVGRPVSMYGQTVWAQGAQYDFAGRLSNFQHYVGTDQYNDEIWATESYGYNTMGQLTSMNWTNPTWWPTAAGVQYSYSGTQNNGQITQAQDGVSGQTTVYGYDALKRLISASATGGTPWTETFGYDGFGNLTSKVLNGAANPMPVNAATNRLVYASYDANGNMTAGAGVTMTYDEANRVTSATQVSGGTEMYGYAPDNRRVFRAPASASIAQWTLWGAYGEKLGTYEMQQQPQSYDLYPYMQVFSPTVSFAGRTILDGGAVVIRDRLGSNRGGKASYYPYGEEITSTPNDALKFATYTRDSFTGFDYADQRYYASTYGRFNSPDPARGSAGPGDPGSWNRYVYVEGDAVNALDPRGLFLESADGNGRDGCYYNGMWISGCDIAIGPTSFAPVTAFAKAANNLGAAAQAFEDRASFSQKCQNDIAAVAAAAPSYIDASTITIGNLQNAASTTSFANGLGSQVSQSALYPTSPQAAGVVAGQTIGALFANPNSIVTAVTTLGGSTIYINPSQISGNLGTNEGLLMHELLHELGLTDDAIGEGLHSVDPFITPDSNGNWTNTKQFTAKFTKDCFSGKDNKN